MLRVHLYTQEPLACLWGAIAPFAGGKKFLVFIDFSLAIITLFQ
nr:MAG TPA: hypothetical protein [Caudoviricetes sp.]